MSISELDNTEEICHIFTKSSGYQCPRKVFAEIYMARVATALRGIFLYFCYIHVGPIDEGVRHDFFQDPLEISFSSFLKRR